MDNFGMSGGTVIFVVSFQCTYHAILDEHVPMVAIDGIDLS
jgi:hypothetical protein